jgi:hypothetical protein
MKAMRVAVSALLSACAVVVAVAANAAPSAPVRAVRARTTASPGTKYPAPAAVAPRARSSADSAARARPRVAPRMLDDIHIEGEIPVPQVLFITARDQRRFMEFQHHRYQKTSLELGRATATPARIVVTSPTPAERKEMQR